MSIELHWRLEPPNGPRGDLQRGFSAELADPLWMLARQWQMGEHRGENASTPLRVRLKASSTPLLSPDDRPTQDPTQMPGEAIIEGGAWDAWPLSQRIEYGLRAQQSPQFDALSDAVRDACLLHDLPELYAALSDTLATPLYDGLKLFQAGVRLADVPKANGNHWRERELDYETGLPCGDTVLEVSRHDGGEVDWWTVDAAAPLTATASKADQTALPMRFRYPGAPLPRFWQIEDRNVDIGGFPPDRAHFPTLLLIDLIASHSDDWFTFPVATSVGHVLRVHELEIEDSFGDVWPKAGGQWPAADGWGLFRVTGLDPAPEPGQPAMASLPIWPTAATPLSGPPQEELVLGVDEDANVLWAVEQRIDGRECVPNRIESDAAGRRPQGHWRYRPTSDVPAHWHPYLITEPAADGAPTPRRFVQARLGDLHTDDTSTLAPAARAMMLTASSGIHEIEPATIPVTGLRLEQRFLLARRCDGMPVLWQQRERLPLFGPPSHALLFDRAVPVPPSSISGSNAPPIPSPSPAPGTSPAPANETSIGMVRPPEDDPPELLAPDRPALPDTPPTEGWSADEMPVLATDPAVANPAVALAQALLNAAGASDNDGLALVVDGVFGPRTAQSLATYKLGRTLPTNDAIDVDTWASLLTLAPMALLMPGPVPPAGPPIARAQQCLNRIGVRPLLDTSGMLDELTSAALSVFQGERGLVQSGGLELSTWLALARAESEANTPTAWLRLWFNYDRTRQAEGGALVQFETSASVNRPLASLPPSTAAPGAAGPGCWFELRDDLDVLIHRGDTGGILPWHSETYGEGAALRADAPATGRFAIIVPLLPLGTRVLLFGPDSDPELGAAPVLLIELRLE